MTPGGPFLVARTRSHHPGKRHLGTLLPEPAPARPFLSSAASEVIPHYDDWERSGRGRDYVGTLTVTVSADIDAFPP
jgi:hypothetical protein